eukprot:TRINITY_DN2679_c0_g1_i6.p1 TRINITY_DN2679_c0_g1~~TRINITY_DN2679_c0_g1_i6.p1  ORF type:complete len:261 (+),score=58.10 TRINITY_DN2679_c0_g1_i6:26-784(+)
MSTEILCSCVSKIEELSSTVRLQGEMLMAQQRFLATMVLEKLTKRPGGEMELLNRLADMVALPSVELVMHGTDDENRTSDAAASAEAEVTVFTDVYKLAKQKGCDRLRKETARMLGPLMLKSDLDTADIEFLEDDLPSVFSSTVFPRLKNEDDYWHKMELSYMQLGESENGLPSDVKQRLLRLLDLPMLSHSVSLKFEQHLKRIRWGPSVLDDLKKQILVQPKRKYKFEPGAVVVTAGFEIGPHPQRVGRSF